MSDNTKLEFYEPRYIEGKRVLSTLDGNTFFPFGTDDEIENTKKYFERGQDDNKREV